MTGNQDSDQGNGTKAESPIVDPTVSNLSFEIALLGLGAVVIAGIIAFTISKGQIPLIGQKRSTPLPVATPTQTPSPPPPTPSPTPSDQVIRQLERVSTSDRTQAIEKDLSETSLDQLDRELESVVKTLKGSQ